MKKKTVLTGLYCICGIMGVIAFCTYSFGVLMMWGLSGPPLSPPFRGPWQLYLDYFGTVACFLFATFLAAIVSVASAFLLAHKLQDASVTILIVLFISIHVSLICILCYYDSSRLFFGFLPVILLGLSCIALLLLQIKENGTQRY